MGLLDHRRHWQYEVAATPDQCIAAFMAAFNGKGGTLVKARWDVRRSGNKASAVYKGRKGFGALATGLTKTGAQEADTALGSTVEFGVDGQSGGRCSCSMALIASGRSGIAGSFGATSDARFIRPYMQAVADELAKIDPGVRVSTN